MIARTPRQPQLPIRAAYAPDDAPLFPEPAPPVAPRPAAYRAACAGCGMWGQFRVGRAAVCPACRGDLSAAYARAAGLLASAVYRRYATRAAALAALAGHTSDPVALLDRLEGVRTHQAIVAAARAVGAERWGACEAAIVAAHQAARMAERCARAFAALRQIEGGQG